MKRFLVLVLLAAVLGIVTLFGLSVARCLPHLKAINEAFTVRPDQRIVCLGDSHIGNTFVEREIYANKVLWNNSTPKVFTLIRLLELERRGQLKNVKIVVTEFGYQTISGLTIKNVEYGWMRLYPFSWRYIDKIPVPNWRLLYLAASGDRVISANLGDGVGGAPLTERKAEWIKEDNDRTMGWHFGWLKSNSLDEGWKDDLLKVMKEIKCVCRRNNIEFVIFTSPLSSYYRNEVPQDGKEVLKYWQDEFMRLGVRYFDEMEAMEDKYFRDTNHLSPEGAEKFTSYFLNKINHNQ